MPELIIKRVESRREKKQFIRLPWKIYQGDDMWVPPLIMDLKERAGFVKHPFHEANDTQTFIALRDGEPVGVDIFEKKEFRGVGRRGGGLKRIYD